MKLKYLTIMLILLIPIAASSSIIDKLFGIADITLEKINDWKLSAKEAMWYRKIADGSVQCRLCPFNCTIAKGRRGICGVRANVGGTLRALTYAKPVTVHIDPIEKKPLFHFLPSSTSYSIATAGCNLSCNFCQNWTISQTLPEDAAHEELTPSQIVAKAIENNCKSISYTYSEPTVFYEYMFDIATIAKKRGIRNVWITCGYINPEPLEKLCTVLDAANVDIKGPQSFYTSFSKASLAPVLQTCKIWQRNGVWLEITYLIVPNANDDIDSIKTLCRWIADSLGIDTPVHFSRFYPNYKLTDRPPTPVETLHKASDAAKSVGLRYVYVGNVPGDDGEDTYCPLTAEKVIDRTGFIVTSNRLDSDGIWNKGFKVAGVWK
jgi:pyruvate formate lyase activating enzyme